MDNEHIPNYQSLSIDESFGKLRSQKNGLSENEAKKRLELYGFNEINTDEDFNYLQAIIENILNPFSIILITAASISFFSKHPIDGFVILLVIIANFGIDIYHKKTAHNNIELLKKGVTHYSTLLRDGNLVKKPVSEIVPGDIIHLEEGDVIPADARLIQVDGLHINESLLTGESLPVQKDISRMTGIHPISDLRNMVWLGSVATEGSGICLVTATAFKTQFGQIAKELKKTQRGSNPFLDKTKKLTKNIGIIGIFIALILFGIQYGIMDQNLGEIAIFSLAVLVSIIPESLPTIMNLTLARGAKALAEEHAVVKELSTVESIGSTTVIITDKTGTLTENSMRVETIITQEGKEFSVTGFGWKKVGMFLHNNHRFNPEEDKTLSQILEYALLGNRSHVYQKDEEDVVIGEPTEAALLVMAEKAGKTRQDILKTYNIVQRTRFLHSHKVLVTIVEKDSQKQILVIGAPETIWKYSSVDNVTITKTEELAHKGLRTIAFAYANVDSVPSDFEKLPNLNYLGFVVMRDPIREGVKETIEQAKNAGIRVIMATGDHAKTARYIAEEIGIIKKGHIGEIMEGVQFLSLDEKSQKEYLKTVSVFARVTPEIKLQITKILQKDKEIVTMIGDGVNDVLALKQADIGVAMAGSGTGAARDASSIVLTNNNFITIVHAILRGRHIFKNIKNVTNFLLSTNAAEALILIIATFLGMPLPLIATQILLINLVTDGIGALPFAFQKPNISIIPRPKPGILLSRFDYGIIASATIGMTIAPLLAFNMFSSESIKHAQSMAFLTLCITQISRLIALQEKKSIKSLLKENTWFIKSIGISFVILVLVFTVNPVRNIFSLEILSLRDITSAFILSLLPLVTVTIYKLIHKK